MPVRRFLSQTMTIRERDLVRIEIGTKNRLGVVMRVLQDEGVAIVLAGTSKPYEHEPNVVVKRDSRYGKALRLSADTYFRKSYLGRPNLDVLKYEGRQCPPGLFIELQRILEEAALTTPPTPMVEGSPYDPGKMAGDRVSRILASESELSEAEYAVAAFALAQHKHAEARELVGAICRNLTAYMLREDDEGRRLATSLPPSAPSTPEEVPNGKFVPSADTWSHPTWEAIKFGITQPLYFSYEIQTAPDGRSAIVRATGDPHGDGKLTVIEQQVSLDEIEISS